MCKNIPFYILKQKECKVPTIPYYNKTPYPPKITNETKGDHNFLYPSNTQHKNVPVTIIDPLLDTFSSEMSIIFYSFFDIYRPSRMVSADVTVLRLVIYFHCRMSNSSGL